MEELTVWCPCKLGPKNQKLKVNRLLPNCVNLILKKCAQEYGIPYVGQFSGHSLRRGLANSEP